MIGQRPLTLYRCDNIIYDVCHTHKSNESMKTNCYYNCCCYDDDEDDDGRVLRVINTVLTSQLAHKPTLFI